MRFSAFFEALSRQEHDSVDWRILSAGLVVLRVLEPLERCAPVPERGVQAAAWELVNVLPAAYVGRAALMRILDVLQVGGGYDCATLGSVIAGPLAAYGRILQANGCWDLAADVFDMCVQFAKNAEARDLEHQARQQAAYSYRAMRRFEEALTRYKALHDVAQRRGDTRFVLEARLGAVKVAADQGNMPKARKALDAVIRDAKAANEQVALGKAYIDRARLQAAAGDFAGSVKSSYRALRLAQDPRDRDRVAVNIGLAYRDLGRTDLARPVLLVVSESAAELEQRVAAVLGLLHVAIDDRNGPAAEAYARRLARQTLAPALAAEYYEMLGHWALVQQQREEAERCYARMRTVCEEHQLHELLMRADTALAALGRASEPVQQAPTVALAGAESRELERIAEATRLRVLQQ